MFRRGPASQAGFGPFSGAKARAFYRNSASLLRKAQLVQVTATRSRCSSPAAGSTIPLPQCTVKPLHNTKRGMNLSLVRRNLQHLKNVLLLENPISKTVGTICARISMTAAQNGVGPTPYLGARLSRAPDDTSLTSSGPWLSEKLQPITTWPKRDAGLCKTGAWHPRVPSNGPQVQYQTRPLNRTIQPLWSSTFSRQAHRHVTRHGTVLVLREFTQG